MKIIQRELEHSSRSDEYRITPIGDVHIGAAACDEDKLRRDVERIKADPNHYWIGMGDYCDFINVSDKRFSVSSLAKWFQLPDLVDIVRVQRDRFLEIMEPIADRCLCLLEGNHETAITRHYERAVYSDIVSEIKKAGGFPADYQLGLGYYGWLLFKFKRMTSDGSGRNASNLIRFNLHHGFTGGRLAGAKALNMQRWLWSHEADLVLFGHSHNTGTQVESVEKVDRNGNMFIENRMGAFCGTYLQTNNPNGHASYAERAGYLPMPTTNIEIVMKPGSKDRREHVRVTAGL